MLSSPCCQSSVALWALHALVQFQLLAFLHVHNGFLPIGTLSRKPSHPLDLALYRHDMDTLDADLECGFDGLLDLHSTGIAMHDEPHLIGGLTQRGNLFRKQ